MSAAKSSAAPAQSPTIQVPCSNCGGQGSTPVTMDMAIDAGDREMAGSAIGCSFCNGQGFHLELVEPDSVEWWKQIAQKVSVDYFDLKAAHQALYEALSAAVPYLRHSELRGHIGATQALSNARAALAATQGEK